MSQPLPIDEYQWINENEEVEESQLFSNTDAIMNLTDDSEYGYIFEVDLHYPKEIHKTHNDFPFCGEKRKLPAEAFEITTEREIKRMKMENEGMSSDTNDKTNKKKKKKKNIFKKTNNIEKLLLTLNDKENYVLHYRILKLALSHGLVLKNVKRILKFRQSNWLKPYISLNTEMRMKSKNDFEKSFYKLMNNAIYGKTMENLRSRVNIMLANKWTGKRGAGMLIAKPNFKKYKIFNENLVAIEFRKMRLMMSKPIIVGMAVLDISKITMYSFLYDFLKSKYGAKVSIAYTDTDSFVLAIDTEDFYVDMRNNISMFDTSDYPWPNQFNIERKNKKVPGLFKDELNGKVMTEFVGLRAKCYAIRSFDKKKEEEEEEEIVDKMKKSKGVKKNVLKRKITFDDYLDCIERSCEIKRKQNTIRSINHNVYTIEQEKVALSPFDDKRYIIMPNGIDTLAWGHYEIDLYEKMMCAKVMVK